MSEDHAPVAMSYRRNEVAASVPAHKTKNEPEETRKVSLLATEFGAALKVIVIVPVPPFVSIAVIVRR